MKKIYDQASSISQLELERRFLDCFFGASGIVSDYADLPFKLHYSCSSVIDLVADLAGRRGWRVGLVTPTFDNIAAIFRRHKTALHAIEESDLSQAHETINFWDALFIVSPNNPTGHEMSETDFRKLIDICASNDRPIFLDASFRFLRREGYDHYGILKSSGVTFGVIEDTGKTLGHQDLKLGFIITSYNLFGQIEEIADDMLLNVSPFLICLLGELFDALARTGGIQHLRDIVQANRTTLLHAVKPFGLHDMCPTSSIGLGWLRLPSGWDASQLTAALLTEGVGVLPGGPFYWDDQLRGRDAVRIALLRDRKYFAAGVERLVGGLSAFKEKQIS